MNGAYFARNKSEITRKIGKASTDVIANNIDLPQLEELRRKQAYSSIQENSCTQSEGRNPGAVSFNHKNFNGAIGNNRDVVIRAGREDWRRS